MSIDLEELKRRLVVERKRDGRCRYDEAAKTELVAVCSKPGTSVSRIARECGVNANQLSRWIREHRQRQQRAIAAPAKQASDLRPAFMPVSIQPISRAPLQPTSTQTMSLHVSLPNGVVIDVRDCDGRHASQLIEALGGLRCSASMKA